MPFYTGPRTLRTDHLKADVVTSSGAFTMFAKNFIPSGSGDYNVGATSNPVSNLYVEDKVYLTDQQFYVDYWEYLKYKNAFVLTGALPTQGGGGGGGNLSLKTYSYTGNGIDYNFYFPSLTQDPNNLIVSIGGAVQTPLSDYKLTGVAIGEANGGGDAYSGISFVEPPDYLEDIEVREFANFLAVTDGETNTASNLGVGSGVGVFYDKYGADLRFRRIGDGLGTYARIDPSTNMVRIDSKQGYQGRIPFPADGDVKINLDGPAFQTLFLEDTAEISTTDASRSPISVNYFTSVDQRAGIKNVSIRIIGGQQSRNIFFADDITWLGDKPFSVASQAVGILSLTSFGPEESQTVAAWGEELYDQPFYFPVVQPAATLDGSDNTANHQFDALFQMKPFVGSFEFIYKGTGAYLNYPSGMVNGQTIEVMLKPYDHLSSISFCTKFRFSEESCGFCNTGLNDVLTSGMGPIWTGYVGHPASGGWFGTNGVMTDGLIVKRISGLSSGVRHSAGHIAEPNATNTGIDLLTIKNINENYLTTVNRRFI